MHISDHTRTPPKDGYNKNCARHSLRGSIFLSPCAPAQGRVQRTRPAATAAGLRLLYHDTRLNKTAPAAVLHGFLREKASARIATAAGLRLLYHDAAKRPQQNRTRCGFAWFNVLKPMPIRACGGFKVIIMTPQNQQNRTRCGFASMFSPIRTRTRTAATAAGLRLLYHLPSLYATRKFPSKTRVFS